MRALFLLLLGPTLWGQMLAPILSSPSAGITVPAPGSRLTSDSVTFSWVPIAGAQRYAVYFGTTLGGIEITSIDVDTSVTSSTIAVPVLGSTIYARLFVRISDAWNYLQDYTYTLPSMVPDPGSVLPASTVTFKFAPVTNADDYMIWFGSAFETYNLDAVETLNATPSLTTTLLPTTGATVYTLLFAHVGSGWIQIRHDTYTEATWGLLSPAPGSTLSSAGVDFTFRPMKGATTYQLWFGTTNFSNDLGYSTESPSTTHHFTLPTLGATVYVTVFGKINNAYQHAASAAFTEAGLQTPANGSTLTSYRTTFTWAPITGSTDYAIWVGTAPRTSDISGGAVSDLHLSGTSMTLNTPASGETLYVTFLTYIGTWAIAGDYTYTAFTQMLSPTPGSTLTSISSTFTFATVPGAILYSIWEGTTPGGFDLAVPSGPTPSFTVIVPTTGAPLYIRAWAQLADESWVVLGNAVYTQPAFHITAPTNGNTLTTSPHFTWTLDPNAPHYGIRVGSTLDGVEYGVSTGAFTSYDATLPVLGNTVYVIVYAEVGGVWYTVGRNTYTGPSLDPAPGSTLPGAAVTFTWAPVPGATWYFLDASHIGAGGNELCNFDAGTTPSAASSVAFLAHVVPTTGATLYVRLYWQVDGVWSHSDYTYTEAGIQTPASSSTLSGSSVTFTWGAIPGADTYSIWASHTAGGSDLVNQGTEALTTTATVPTLGRTLYVRFYYHIGSVWAYIPYTFTEATQGIQTPEPKGMAPRTEIPTNTSVTFTWAHLGTDHELWIGITIGGLGVSYNAALGDVDSFNATLTAVTPGTPLYVRWWSLVNAVWQSVDYIYTAAP